MHCMYITYNLTAFRSPPSCRPVAALTTSDLRLVAMQTLRPAEPEIPGGADYEGGPIDWPWARG